MITDLDSPELIQHDSVPLLLCSHCLPEPTNMHIIIIIIIIIIILPLYKKVLLYKTHVHQTTIQFQKMVPIICTYTCTTQKRKLDRRGRERERERRRTITLPFSQSPGTSHRSDQRAKCLHSVQNIEPCSSVPCRHYPGHQHGEHLLPVSTNRKL